MVFIEDKGSIFKAPIEQIWRLLEAHNYEGDKIHPGNKNRTTEKVAENVFMLSWENEVQGRIIKSKERLTNYPPVGRALEFLEGRLAGSKAFVYYAPKENETEVNVIGEWKSSAMSDEEIKKNVLSFLQHNFEEDSAYLKTMKY